ncbi:MAG: 5-oxoprolinase subunit PxpB [Rhizobiaceae bacterium]|nr:5-oxoprolinase subunit PxpB [Rhizobiaceae bacterium]
MYPTPRFLPSGDCALTVEFDSRISAEASEAVVALDRAIAAAAISGVRETVPTYRSLLVFFDPPTIRRAALVSAIAALWPVGEQGKTAGRRWRIPVAFGGAHGEDLPLVAETHGLSEAAVVEIYLSSAYRVAMIGFAPGFAYLSGLDPRLETGRRTEPRRATPPRSVSIGGVQTAISPPLSLPSGWQMIGRTPVRSFDLSRRVPFLFEAGDDIRFERVDAAEYDALDQRAAAGEPVARREDG